MSIGVIVGTIAIVLIVVVVGLLVDRKRSIVPRPSDLRDADKDKRKQAERTYAAGEAPATAIRAAGSALDKLRAQRCATCRAAMTNDPDDTVRYNERELRVLHFSCPACKSRRSLYVEG